MKGIDKMKYPITQAKARGLKKASEKYLFYYNLCNKVFRIHMDTLVFEGVDLLQTSEKYNRIINKATDKRDFWQSEVERILHS